jgi:hypothetical protein
MVEAFAVRKAESPLARIVSTSLYWQAERNNGERLPLAYVFEQIVW